MGTAWKNLVDSKERLAALPIADRKSGNNQIIGTATFILPGLFITAKHNVEHYVKVHENLDIGHSSWEPQNLDLNFYVDVILPLKDDSLVVWHITKAHLMAHDDLVILVASGASGPVDRLIEAGVHTNIDLHIPASGGRFAALGYPATTNDILQTGETLHRLKLTKVQGEVSAIDRSSFTLESSPRIQADVETPGGMSGGPVFDDRGNLFAIITAGSKDGEPNPYAIFTPLTSTILTPLRFRTQSDPEAKMDTDLRQLSERGYLKISGLDHFKINGLNYVFDTKNLTCPDCPESSPLRVSL